MRTMKEPEKSIDKKKELDQRAKDFRIKELEAALDYYCDPDLWYEFKVYGDQSDFSDDMGDKARRALYGPSHTEEEYLKRKEIQKKLVKFKESKK